MVDFISFLSTAVWLKELNKELTRKLESQTQRLELLMSQSMANENIQSRQPDLHYEHENTAYADEGDEVMHLLHLDGLIQLPSKYIRYIFCADSMLERCPGEPRHFEISWYN